MERPSVVIGCPVRHREWILWEWAKFASLSARNADVKFEFMFVVSPLDQGVLDVVEEIKEPTTIVFSDEKDEPDERVWNPSRYEHMARLRNQLLTEVRKKTPDFFLSLDSDILLHPQALTNMIESATLYNAIGGRTYMTPKGRWCPSFSYLYPNGGLNREDFDNVRIVDVIMAIKLMTKSAYAVNYVGHHQGEDIGWSKNCKASHVSIGADGRVVSKHVMDKSMLDKVDERCGY